jgi:hypothetical protein
MVIVNVVVDSVGKVGVQLNNCENVVRLNKKPITISSVFLIKIF